MTIEEKKKKIDEYCNSRELCSPCDGYGDTCPLYENGYGKCESKSNEHINRNYELLFGKEEPTEPTATTTNDIINHPSHYCRDGAMESIDEMVLVFGKDAVKYFCLCNVWKYRYRSSSKNGEEDIKKSDWYMKKFEELCNE